MSEFRSFISESDLEAAKKKRQEEWEKVRRPEDPFVRPEEEYDGRSLYDRLKEQKDKQQAEYEETHKLKNMIRGLDDDEVQFLDLVDRTKEKIETQRLREDLYEIKNFQKAVATLAEQEAEQKLQELKKAATASLLPSKTIKKSVQSLLATAVKRKSSTTSDNSDGKKSKSEKAEENEEPNPTKSDESESSEEKNAATETSIPTVQCIGILPGLGVYSDSSDSDNSLSDLEQTTKYDLLGRPKYQNAD